MEKGRWRIDNKRYSIIVWVIILSLLSLPMTVKAVKKRSSIKDKKQELYNIKKKIEKKKEALREIKKKQRKVTEELRDTQNRLEKTKKDLSYVQMRLTQVRMQKDIVSKKLAELEERFSYQQNRLSLRLNQVYKYGAIRQWEVLLGAEDFWDFLTRVKFLYLVIQSDVDLLKEIKKTKEEISERKRELEEKIRKIKELKEKVHHKKQIIAQEANHKSSLLKDIETKRAVYEQALAELEQNSKEIESWIKKMEAAKSRRRGYYRWRGAFSRPVDGPITSGFGYRTHPIFKITKFHTGVDISAAEGTPIRAAAGGEVIYSDWWGGYGKVVIIDHGGGIATLYAHCSSLAVRVGQRVNQGQVIAYVGSTGLSTGPHLHFEVRKNGVPVNPLGY